MKEKHRKSGVMKSIDELLTEYKQTSRKKRDQMWLMFVDLRNTFDEIEPNARRKCPKCILSPRYECEPLQGDKAGSRPKSYRFASESTISFFKASNSSRKPHFSINQFVFRSVSIFLNKFFSTSERISRICLVPRSSEANARATS